MLCVPKVDITIPAKRHIQPRPFKQLKTAIHLQRHENKKISWVLKTVEKENGKKKWTDLHLASSWRQDKTNSNPDRAAA